MTLLIFFCQQSDGVTITYFVEVCYTTPPSAGLSWVFVGFGYKLILQVATVFLAFKTRNVEVMGLNESKEVRALCVVTTLLTVIVAVLRGTFSDYQNVVGASYALGISTSTAVILTFVFIPKASWLFDLQLLLFTFLLLLVSCPDAIKKGAGMRLHRVKKLRYPHNLASFVRTFPASIF